MLLRSLLAALATLCLGNCSDPPGEGGLQLYFDINVDAAASMGLGDLTSLEIVTSQVTLKFDSPDFTGSELILDSSTRTTELPAVTRITPGPYYNLPTGLITQLRFYPSSVRFHFADGSSADVRVPSVEHTGWKGIVDTAQAPDGYEVAAGHVTGVRLFVDVAELFHNNEPQGWIGRPTIRTSLFNIAASEGYDPDMLAVVFERSTPQTTIDSIITGGGFTIEFMYPLGTKLYKLKKSAAMSLRDAHSYLRGFSSVVAVAPSVRVLPRITPSEGTPLPLRVIDGESGWDAMIAGTGRVGSPAVVVAELSAASGGINLEHPDLRPNIWLNQGEVTAVCGPMADCDPDADGLVTLRDFNHPQFAGVKPADPGMDGITCKDLLAPGSPYLNGIEDNDPAKPACRPADFCDDICGWNFVTQSNDVITPGCNPAQSNCDPDHDSVAAGIMSAAQGFAITAQGPAVGICWECRLMPIVVGQDPGGLVLDTDDVRGSTTELMAAFLYARDNGAHVANLSSGGDYFRASSTKNCGTRRIDVPKDEIFDTFVTEANAIVAETLGADDGQTTLYTMAAGECPTVDNRGLDEGADDYFNWPGEAFFANTATRLISISVAATDNTDSVVGGLAPYSNYGQSIEIAAPGGLWGPRPQQLSPGQVCGLNTTAGCGGAGTSFAAPTVAGIAALIVAGSPTTFAVPNAALLKGILLNTHTTIDPTGLASIPGNRAVTMANLP